MRKSYSAGTGDDGTITLKIRNLDDMEREIIDHLQSWGYSNKEISRLLGTSRTTLWRKAKSL
ncbi:MAG: helix-turn-helix domain-containing protein [Bacillota bacterium]